ncbi:MAG: hypothetical protein ACAI44_17095 [Candidatus Sericytochromatia bacterium]
MKRIIFAAGSVWLSLLCLAGCGQEPTDPAQVSPARVTAKATANPLPPVAEGLIDISGCWRPVGSDGNTASGGSFTFNRVAANAWVFSSSSRTKLVFKPDRSFTEGNFDEEKPFFPKGYIHSTGTVSEDGNAISRIVGGQETKPQLLRRCNLVNERQPVPFSSKTPAPDASPVPGTSSNPLILPEESPSPQPSPLKPTAVPSATPSANLSTTPSTEPGA